MTTLPVIDLSGDAPASVADRIDDACRRYGFFVVTGHGIDPSLLHRLEHAAREFFERPTVEKAAIAMPLAGTAWRGWFPAGDELTAGVPDGKEGIYFGEELPVDHPRVAAGVPLHGRNLFPAEPADLRPAVVGVMEQLTHLGHRLLSAMALGLGLDPDWFSRGLTAEPTVLFRIFHYPEAGTVDRARWGVAEHTDYGLLTILRQDDVGGLQVCIDEDGWDTWIDVPPVADAFVCNLGDMLERMTGGLYRSTRHRVVAPPRSRLSFPFFFDPSWDAVVEPIPGLGRSDAGECAADGTYGDYLTAKVARVFPHLWDDVGRRYSKGS